MIDLSVVIPTYNEADQVLRTIKAIRAACSEKKIEIIIADGGSTDQTLALARTLQVVTLSCPKKGRGPQMNQGAQFATGNLLYFIHADSIPPQGFDKQIRMSVDSGNIAGCFRLKFDHRHWFLEANAWFTRFNVNAVRFGDQSLYVTREHFIKSNGFREDLVVMEDQEIIGRLRRLGRFCVMNDYVITSARKYIDNGIYRMQAIFYLIWSLYYLGVSQHKLVSIYKRLIRKHKLD